MTQLKSSTRTPASGSGDEFPSPPLRGEREGDVGPGRTAGVSPACRPEAGGPFGVGSTVCVPPADTAGTEAVRLQLSPNGGPGAFTAQPPISISRQNPRYASCAEA